MSDTKPDLDAIEATVSAGPALNLSDYDRARHLIADLTTPSGLVLGDVVARLVLDSGAVVPATESWPRIAAVQADRAEAAEAERDRARATAVHLEQELTQRLGQIRALADDETLTDCECGHGLDQHNGLGCYARLSYNPLVTCMCPSTDDRTHEEVVRANLLRVLDGDQRTETHARAEQRVADLAGLTVEQVREVGGIPDEETP